MMLASLVLVSSVLGAGTVPIETSVAASASRVAIYQQGGIVVWDVATGAVLDRLPCSAPPAAIAMDDAAVVVLTSSYVLRWEPGTMPALHGLEAPENLEIRPAGKGVMLAWSDDRAFWVHAATGRVAGIDLLDLVPPLLEVDPSGALVDAAGFVDAAGGRAPVAPGVAYHLLPDGSVLTTLPATFRLKASGPAGLVFEDDQGQTHLLDASGTEIATLAPHFEGAAVAEGLFVLVDAKSVRLLGSDGAERRTIPRSAPFPSAFHAPGLGPEPAVLVDGRGFAEVVDLDDGALRLAVPLADRASESPTAVEISGWYVDSMGWRLKTSGSTTPPVVPLRLAAVRSGTNVMDGNIILWTLIRVKNPQLFGDTVVSPGEGAIEAFDGRTSMRRWKVNVPPLSVVLDPGTLPGAVVIGWEEAAKHRWKALDLATGKPFWEGEGEPQSLPGLSAVGTRVIVLATNDGLEVRDAANKRVASLPEAGSIIGSVPGKGLLMASEGRWVGLFGPSGVVWRRFIEGPFLVAESRLVAQDRGRLVALEPATGDLLWTHPDLPKVEGLHALARPVEGAPK